MQRLLGVLLGLCLSALCLSAAAKTTATTTQSKQSMTDAPVIQAMFSPEDDVQSEIVHVLGRAKKTIHVQAYLLTNNVITNALIAAHQRGVKVRVLLDNQLAFTAAGSDVGALQASGIVVKLETAYDNAHNKVMLIDVGEPSSVLITGSYNFTVAAQRKNAENILFIRQAPNLLKQYLSNWLSHEKNAKIYTGTNLAPANKKRF
ncbi:MAG: phospholipase D-like domain-containing protein [Formosimonas sp.]|jgi:phosphatidylserine/phosphatidylglycerophosphate/cardiolipin synthase-like enzyme